ncbi:MAG: GNAT family N-acetyltransferase [Acidobacteria bacterium]|nr:GNAT family N-acetyltransferase [Acidobacteriota bacterium]MCA1639219.1 GNAT family N-acetyltransferase [Acidobacteriota bacterium]
MATHDLLKMFSYQIDENLKLTLSQQHQAEEITKVVRENLEQLKTWMPWAKDDYSIDSAREFIKLNLTEFARNGSFSASVILEERFVGGVGFHKLDLRNKSAHVGYWLAKEAQGKGIMTRCCRVLFNYLFNDFGLNRIQINCNIENTKSRAIPERLNFKLEGIHRQVEFLHDEFRDWAVYAMLKEEWRTFNI